MYVGSIIEGFPVANVLGGPLDGLAVVGPEDGEQGVKLILNASHQYTWCFEKGVWNYEGAPSINETGFRVLRLAALAI
jgi:hypothetical protein